MADARELIATSCRVIGGLGLTKATTGHVSQRASDGKHILIRVGVDGTIVAVSLGDVQVVPGDIGMGTDDGVLADPQTVESGVLDIGAVGRA